ncbi:hypothetical protein BASA50_006435 [Batrachochytrium salamandrivorans]|uniref:Thioredoxin domain-containing protein n=1 Tax=Batrachochytrium salamandrivorans TaxID=1357716 RepID=A0ABQ8FD38_9FUNG|nr:hypothetical protein BASA62_002330 [Batrachochytrium salamandrivorans]KAH6583451.1 hypothetical protein BASA60_001447 [Batrachochytrium salamandrivorans]KAH6594760.1 hypothetical protein BASA50_006435 [Batrachochytrium salamandrivorans]KAH9267471.1 thioredoxin [Batrachochytrium salamandrivorans]KAH9276690.1 thioredoxin [Batrachochytrium salamandrivorans]
MFSNIRSFFRGDFKGSAIAPSKTYTDNRKMGADKVVTVTSAAAFQEILAKNPTVVVDFFATWCGPCKVISPKFHEFSNKFESVVFVEVDVDAVPEVAETAGIRAMPTFQLYKNGKLADEIVGADPNKLLSLIEKHQ